MDGITNAMNKMTGKDEWGVSKQDFEYFKDHYGITPEIDVCASDYSDNEFIIKEMDVLYEGLGIKYTLTNSKCKEFYTIKNDMFKQKITKNMYINPPYRKPCAKKGLKGIGDFIEYVYNQHVENNVELSIIIPSFATSSIYYQKYMGEEDINIYGEMCQVKKIPKRLQFECRHGFPVGSPAFSSLLIIFSKH